MDTRFLGIADLTEAPAVAVVVDVMHAFTVAAWAFAQGAEKIVLAESLDEALALKAGQHTTTRGDQGSGNQARSQKGTPPGLRRCRHPH